MPRTRGVVSVAIVHRRLVAIALVADETNTPFVFFFRSR